MKVWIYLLLSEEWLIWIHENNAEEFKILNFYSTIWTEKLWFFLYLGTFFESQPPAYYKPSFISRSPTIYFLCA